MMKNWMERLRSGQEESLESIHDEIEAWHTGQSNKGLHEHLGMTWAEYASWVESKSRLWEIIYPNHVSPVRAGDTVAIPFSSGFYARATVTESKSHRSGRMLRVRVDDGRLYTGSEFLIPQSKTRSVCPPSAKASVLPS